MIVTGTSAAIFFAVLGYWLLAHRGHFWLGALSFVIVGALIGGTVVGSGLAHRAVIAANGLYNLGVSIVHG